MMNDVFFTLLASIAGIIVLIQTKIFNSIAHWFFLMPFTVGRLLLMLLNIANVGCWMAQEALMLLMNGLLMCMLLLRGGAWWQYAIIIVWTITTTVFYRWGVRYSIKEYNNDAI